MIFIFNVSNLIQIYVIDFSSNVSLKTISVKWIINFFCPNTAIIISQNLHDR